MAAKALQNLGPVRSGAVVGVILAGGEGRRMGPGPLKPLRPLAGKPMIAHVVERLRPQVMDLVIVANDPDPAFKTLKVPVVAAIGGSWMVDKQLVNDGKWDEITRLTREALEAAAAC